MEKHGSLSDWILTFLIICIPLVGMIMLFVWSFSENTPPWKKKWAQAKLIWGLITCVLFILLLGFWLLSRNSPVPI